MHVRLTFSVKNKNETVYKKQTCGIKNLSATHTNTPTHNIQKYTQLTTHCLGESCFYSGTNHDLVCERDFPLEDCLTLVPTLELLWKKEQEYCKSATLTGF